MRKLHCLALALPLALIAPMALAPAQASAGEDEGSSYDYGAKVKIELRQENGAVVKHRGEIRSFGNIWTFEFEGEGHRHRVTLNVEGEEGKKQLEVELSYTRDGMAIIAPYTDTYTARKRQSLWTEDGQLAIALTFYPTKFEREDESREDKDKLDPGDSDDPLGPDLFK